MLSVDDFRLHFNKQEIVPIVIGGMGVDISTSDLALEAARLGGIGHISDAMLPAVSDRRYGTHFVSNKLEKYKDNIENPDKSTVQFDLSEIELASRLHVEHTMQRKKGSGLIFINCMEKLSMNNPKEALRSRLKAALDGGIEGITLAAGLHIGSFQLIEDHPRYNDVKLGIIVSSVRALQIFLRKNSAKGRLPDYIVIEGPLAGGHLGFGADWAQYNLTNIVIEISQWLHSQHLNIPIIAAGGVFTGSDAVALMQIGASAVQVATRFTITLECGLPTNVKQRYFQAKEDDIEVNFTSPTGYPMRMLKSSPSTGAGIRPNCESFGYLLNKGSCAYLEAYNREVALHPDATSLHVMDKTCLCTHMRSHNCWTCGHTTYRLKDTSIKDEYGNYLMLSAEHVFLDYQFSTDHKIHLPQYSPIKKELLLSV